MRAQFEQPKTKRERRPIMPRGPKPNPAGTSARQRAQWTEPDSVGWRFGEIPPPPDGIGPDAADAWTVWLGSWWAGFYSPGDLPGLELMIRSLDRFYRGLLDIGKVVPLLDRYGITPKGRQDLRWTPPVMTSRESSSPLAPVRDDLAELRRTRIR